MMRARSVLELRTFCTCKNGPLVLANTTLRRISMIRILAFAAPLSLLLIAGCSKEDSKALKDDVSNTYEDAKNATTDDIHDAAENVAEKTK
jgi:hypothetical protein